MKKRVILFTQGYLGDRLFEILQKTDIPFLIYTYAHDATRRQNDRRYLRDGYPIRYIQERSFDPTKIELTADDIILCADWTKDFFHQYYQNSPQLNIYHAHMSLLPYFRGYGAVSEQFALGAAVSGVTVYMENGKVDAGDIVYQKSIKIEFYHYPTDFIDRSAVEIVSFLQYIYNGNTLSITPQDDRFSSYLTRPRHKQGLINFNLNAISVYNAIRAYSYPFFGSYFYRNDIKTTVWRALCENWTGDFGSPGDIIAEREDGLKSHLEIACGEGSVVLEIDNSNEDEVLLS